MSVTRDGTRHATSVLVLSFFLLYTVLITISGVSVAAAATANQSITSQGYGFCSGVCPDTVSTYSMPCPQTGYFFCWQVEPYTSNTASATVTSSCDNPYTGQMKCAKTPLCTSPSPCFGDQFNYITSNGEYIIQVGIDALGPSSSQNPGYWNIWWCAFNLEAQGGCSEPTSGTLLHSADWYAQAVTIAIYPNGTMWWGQYNGLNGNSQSTTRNPFGTTYGMPADTRFEAAVVGESEGEYATFSGYGGLGVITTQSFPSPSGHWAGVQGYGESSPMTLENSNL